MNRTVTLPSVKFKILPVPLPVQHGFEGSKEFHIFCDSDLKQMKNQQNHVTMHFHLVKITVILLLCIINKNKI